VARDAVIPIMTEQIKKLPIRINSLAVDWDQWDLKRDNGVDYYLIMQCISGNGYIIHNGLEYKVKPDMFILWAPGEPQYYKNTGTEDWVVNWLSFNGKDIPLSFDYQFFITDKVPASIGISKWDTIITLIREGSPSSQIRAVSVLYELLCEINIASTGLDYISDNFKISKITSYMSQNLTVNLTLHQLSKLYNISESYLCRMFQKHFQTTPIQYFTELRINKAKRLLVFDPIMKIYKIAEICGYEDSVYFSRIFKKHTGVKPGEYRKQNKF